MSKKLSSDILSIKTTHLTAFLPHGDNHEKYTLSELTSAYTRLRDMTRKTLQRQETFAKKNNIPTYSMNGKKGESLIPKLADMKKQYTNEEHLKRALIVQMQTMNSVHKQASIGTASQRKKEKELIKRYNQIGLHPAFPTSNDPTKNRNNMFSAFDRVKKFMRESEYGYEKRGAQRKVELRGRDDILNQQIHEQHLTTDVKTIKNLYTDFVSLVDSFYH